MYHEWKPYVPVAVRRRNAIKELAKLKKRGAPVVPVVIDGRTIANTFWGKAWCENLEGYSDFSNRLPRGRTYVRNGSVVDLQIDRGRVAAWVSGSQLYKVQIQVAGVAKARWSRLISDCAGEIDSLVELLQGRMSQAIMQRMCTRASGLFPAPPDIRFECSCPDWADMCKHVAAALYGVGARLDHKPELLFALRAVDEQDLVAKAGTGLRTSPVRAKKGRLIEAADLSDVFGIDLDESPAREPAAKAEPRARPSRPSAAARKPRKPPRSKLQSA